MVERIENIGQGVCQRKQRVKGGVIRIERERQRKRNLTIFIFIPFPLSTPPTNRWCPLGVLAVPTPRTTVLILAAATVVTPAALTTDSTPHHTHCTGDITRQSDQNERRGKEGKGRKN